MASMVSSSSRRPALLLDVASRLTTKEEGVLDICLAAGREAGTTTVVRVAGGWVRDKLLGLESDDMDIALDDCSGVHFAEVVNSYLRSRGDPTSLGVIKANPAQSKHLETARMKVCDEWIDCVNLRTESYGQDSRIPEIKFGTPEEDAYRRDFTVNALFYNASSKEVEDWTNKGLEDLRDGLIRTPLAASVTLLDDPLRVLRGIRFAARFDFRLHEDLVAAARDLSVQRALASKVSKERLGSELDGMLKGKAAKPFLAFSHLHSLGLLSTVFTPPADVSPVPEGGFDWDLPMKGVLCLRYLHKQAEGVETERLLLSGGEKEEGACTEMETDAATIAPCPPAAAGPCSTTTSAEHDRLLYLAAGVLPLAGACFEEKKGQFFPAALYVIRESLKLKTKDAQDVCKLLDFSTWRDLAQLHEQQQQQQQKGQQGVGIEGASQEPAEGSAGGGCSRLRAGLAVRDAKDMWRACIDMACVVELCGLFPEGPLALPSESSGEKVLQVESCRAIVERYRALKHHIVGLGLDGVWRMKPLWDGQAMVNLLKDKLQKNVKPGPAVGKMMQVQLEWQLEHPSGTKEELMRHLEGKVAAVVAEAQEEAEQELLQKKQELLQKKLKRKAERSAHVESKG